MKLKDMLTEVGILVPNDIPPDVQVSWMNQVQNSLYRFYGTSETPYNFVVQPGVSFYVLPANCLEERARRLVVDGIELTFVPPYEDDNLAVNTKYWSVISKQIFIAPVPDTMKNAVLYYQASPTALSLSAIDTEATFPADYIELLILGCAVKVAIATKSDVLTAIQMQYDALKQQAERILGNKRQKVVNTRPWI